MCKIKYSGYIFLAVLSGAGLIACRVDDPSSVKGRFEVGVYNGAGSWEPSVTALRNAVGLAGFTSDVFDQNDLFTDGANRFDIVIVPGGDPRALISAFGSMGRSKIQSFVQFGGSYIGLGAGASIADTTKGQWPGLGLFYGQSRWPCDNIAPYPEYTLTEIVKAGWDPPLCRVCADRYLTLYRWGPELMPSNLAAVDVIYNYQITSTPAILSFKYGVGKVILSGCQLEIEENDSRDSTAFGGELNDPDSEWDILREMLLFCISED